jgi:N6-adenosine-specific RNA methylase IME4
MKFDIIVADPCWTFKDSLKMSSVPRGAEANYSLLDNAEITKLDVENIAADDAVLALWVPSSLLQEGLDTMKAWGFEQKQTWIWVKVKNRPFGVLTKTWLKDVKKYLKDGKWDALQFSDIKELFEDTVSKFSLDDILAFYMGRLFRGTHEICLIGTRGKIYNKLKNKSQRSVSFDINFKHSAKPETLQDRLELMFPQANYLELFARRDRKNWECVGLECPTTLNEDIRDSIIRLLKKK